MVFRTYTDEVTRRGDNFQSYEAAEAILQGQAVALDETAAGERIVRVADTQGESAIGFAQHDAAAGEDINVARDGCEVRATSATGTIEMGDPVTVADAADAAKEPGEVETATETQVSDGTAAGTLGDYLLGYAVSDDAGAHGDVWVEVNAGGRV